MKLRQIRKMKCLCDELMDAADRDRKEVLKMASKERRFADDGWAVWVDGDDTSTVYLNEWINPKGKSFVDVGIRIRGVKATHALNIYVPFFISAADIQDISLTLKNEAVLRAVFSAVCLIDFRKNAYTSEVAYNGKTIDLVHISSTGFKAEPFEDGTMITVALDEINPYLANDEAYFLFRIPHNSLNEIFKPSVSVGAFLTRLRDLITSPVVSERYGYSVRINEARMLPTKINRIGLFHRQKLKKAVVTISIDEEYELNDSNCYRIRRLEEKLYRDYAPSGFPCHDAITYQWNESREKNLRGHFNFYFDISYQAIDSDSMMIYIILLMVTGVAGGALWDLIKYLFSFI